MSTLLLKTIKTFVTHILFSAPRLCFSTTQKQAILDWGRKMKASAVPSLYAINKCQRQILELVGDPTEKVVSKSGTVFYQNNIGKAIAQV